MFILQLVLSNFQCQPSWTHLQCVVSRGENPLPAEIRIKCSKEDSNEFFYMDPKDWYTNKMPRKVYADPVQEGIRRILGRSLVRTFALFKYKKHSLVNVYCATFDAPHKAKIREVIDIVEYEFTQHEKTMNDIIKNLADQGKNAEAEWMTNCVDILVKNFAGMSSAFLARQILDMTHSFHVNKNWNSHGSQVGAAMCQLGSILASFEDASN